METEIVWFACLISFALGGATLVFLLLMGLVGRAEAKEDRPWLSRPRNLLGLAVLLAAFGLTGLAALPYMGPGFALAVAACATGAAYLGVRWVRGAYSAIEPETGPQLDRAVGQTATVYVPVPAQRTGAGRVLVNLRNQPLECQAKTDFDNLPAGTRVRIAGVLDHDTLLVTPVPDALPGSRL